MGEALAKRDIAVSMRFREDDLGLIDRGAALHEAQLAILNETVIRLSPDAFDQFCAAIDAPIGPIPAKLAERFARKAPWDTDATETSPAT
jgi:uncharacterized protein (DUF1778 family)